MYGHVEGKMTEETPHDPVSRKGAVRATVAGMLLEAFQTGYIGASIARTADLDGPYAIKTNLPYLLVFEETVEMLYQYAYDYQFDSTKFERHFRFTPTPYREGIEATVRWLA
ncbi:MAG: hypothetical protein IMX05_02535 [Hydrogenibacillus schlegelii]|nr:hypothetical protein [Hydrogenibacillus schlegelii]